MQQEGCFSCYHLTMNEQTSIAQKIYTAQGITKENVFSEMKVVRLGCGKSKLKGAIGVDSLRLPGVDVVHDLDSFSWPFEDASVDIIFAHSVLERLGSVPHVFEEMWRIGKNGARVVVTVPYFRSVDAFVDPTHTHFFTSGSLDYFIEGENSLSNYEYTKHKFRKTGFWYGWPQSSRNPFARIFKKYIHAHPWLYDQYLSLLFPMKILVWELEIIK